jgi:hypothetical protein
VLASSALVIGPGQTSPRSRASRGDEPEFLFLNTRNLLGHLTRLAVIAWLGMHNYTYLSLRAGGHFSVKEVAKSFADMFTMGIATRE